jgi:catalase
MNIDDGLAEKVADGLGLPEMPVAAEPARPVVQGLPNSPALSIIQNGPKSFKGRKLGVLVSDGVDGKLLAALQSAALAEGAMIEFIAPKVGGFKTSSGELIPAQQKVNGGPSVLYDAVAVLLSAAGAKLLSAEATAKDFVNDAYAHAKFIAYSEEAMPLFHKAGLTEMDGGFVALKTAADAKAFIHTCGKLRFWDREALVHAV